jgi:tripartite-type tricarboxylate transporter receptor subunit TctC
MLSVMAGESSFMFMDMTVVMPHVKANRVKLLAVVAPKRIPEVPEAPTMTEAGYPDVGPGGWTIIFVPAGTPRPIVDKLNAEVKGILALPDVQNALGSDASEFGSNTPEYVRAYVKAEIDRWGKVIKASGVRDEMERR